MKFTCERALFQAAVNTVFRTASTKSTIPALEGILIEAGADVVLTGYNMKTGIKTILSADIKSAGAVVIEARILSELIRRLPDDVVFFTTEDNGMVNIKCGVSDFNILSIGAEDYPELPDVQGGRGFEIAEDKLKTMISKTVFSVSESEARPVHTGELFEVSENELTIVAVDGYRMAFNREEIENSYGGEIKFVVPAVSLKELEKIIGDEEKKVKVILGEKHIMFKMEGTTLISRLLDGEFLNYKKSIPKNNPIVVKTTTREIQNCVDRVSLIISESMKSPVKLVVGDGNIVFTSTTMLGNVSDICQTDGDGEGLEIGINGRYMLDALKVIPDEELKIEFSAPTSPIVLLPKLGKESWLYMILPVRLK